MFDVFDRQIFRKGDIVFRYGDEGDCAYLIEQGEVEILLGEDGREQRIGLIGKGELFGEIALIDHQPRTATARAAEDAVLVPIQRRVIDNLLEKADPILRHLLLLILERFRNRQDAKAASLNHRTEDDSLTRQRDAVRGAATQKLSLAHGITRALVRDEFELYYQPICNLGDGTIAGFEALIRWHHPTGGLIPPADFIWLAEQTGLIQELGLWTLERACRDWPHLRKFAAVESPFVSVNLSASQLTGEGLVEHIREIIERHAMPSAELKLELTETVVVERPETAMQILNRLVELGCTLALDDYGTGYSGLEHLQRYPFKTLKLDRAFITQMIASEESLEIVRSSVNLAHFLGMRVVAEGIETEAARGALMKLGCEYGQGWLFGRPVPLDQYRE